MSINLRNMNFNENDKRAVINLFSAAGEIGLRLCVNVTRYMYDIMS